VTVTHVSGPLWYLCLRPVTLCRGKEEPIPWVMALPSPVVHDALPGCGGSEVVSSEHARGSSGHGLMAIPAAYRPAFIQSATRSAIMIVVVLMFARITSGITEASTTRSPSSPCTQQNWSTTAIGSEVGPILHVPAE